MSTTTAVSIEGLSKTFGSSLALDNLSLEVPTGSVFGLLGRNGAGKTTLLRSVLGLLRPDCGTVRVFGEDLLAAPIELRSRVAYVPQETRLFGRMTLKAHAKVMANFYPRFDLDAARRLSQRLDVDWNKRFSALSVGNRRKAVVVLAMASRADLIVMDEPAAGLDPIARRELYDMLIERLGEGEDTTVMLSTHLVSDLEKLADHVAFIDRGYTRAVGDMQGFAERFARVQIIFTEDVPLVFELPGATRTSRQGNVAQGIVDIEKAGGELLALEADPTLNVRRFPVSLEDLFVDLVGQPTATA